MAKKTAPKKVTKSAAKSVKGGAIKKTSYKIGIMTGLAFFALGCFIFFVDRISASYPLSKVRETRVLTVYMIIGCVILLGTAFILPRHRAVGRRPVLPD